MEFRDLENSKGYAMRKLVDITGRTFGKLTVIKYAGYYKWECVCDCGTICVIRAGDLKSGDTTSCGCYRKEKATRGRTSGEASFGRLFRTYVRNARLKNREFLLSEGQFKELVEGDCYYCGNNPTQIIKNNWDTGEFLYNGIDRVDNDKGYSVDNCVSCCKLCNFEKSDYPIQEFSEWVVKVYNCFILKHKGRYNEMITR